MHTKLLQLAYSSYADEDVLRDLYEETHLFIRACGAVLETHWPTADRGGDLFLIGFPSDDSLSDFAHGKERKPVEDKWRDFGATWVVHNFRMAA